MRYTYEQSKAKRSPARRSRHHDRHGTICGFLILLRAGLDGKPTAGKNTNVVRGRLPATLQGRLPPALQCLRISGKTGETPWPGQRKGGGGGAIIIPAISLAVFPSVVSVLLFYTYCRLWKPECGVDSVVCVVGSWWTDAQADSGLLGPIQTG